MTKYRVSAGKGSPISYKMRHASPITAECYTITCAEETVKAYQLAGYNLVNITEANTGSLVYESINGEATTDKRHDYLMREAREFARTAPPAPEPGT